MLKQLEQAYRNVSEKQFNTEETIIYTPSQRDSVLIAFDIHEESANLTGNTHQTIQDCSCGSISCIIL